MEGEDARRTAARDRFVIAHAKLTALQTTSALCRPELGEYISQEFFEAIGAWLSAANEYSRALEGYARESVGTK
jgi:hypothetical protein